ncbi:MAG TPA: urease accessory protein UreE [Burkholderiaceae bacterium]
MLTLHTKVATAAQIAGELTLPYELREKSRVRAVLDTGEEVAIVTVRGTVLRGGDLLAGDDGRVVLIHPAREATYRVRCDTAGALLRCAFHLGNRHTQTQVGSSYLRIRADAVLREMLLGLGAQIDEELAPFEPEAGAYGGGHSHRDGSHLLAPVPLRQKIHRPSDPA